MKTAQYNKKKIMAKKSTTREIAFGFAMIILTGTILLTLPISVKSGSGISLRHFLRRHLQRALQDLW